MKKKVHKETEMVKAVKELESGMPGGCCRARTWNIKGNAV